MTNTSVTPHLKFEFAYDYLGRRVQKTKYVPATPPASGWTFSSANRYLYDGWPASRRLGGGWNLVAEFDAPGGTSLGSLVRSYTWGLDVVGSLTATGGVGALVQITDHSSSPSPTSYFPTYDGNGNVASLLNADTGAVEAAYEYSPFGELLRSEGTYASSNPFRFSTKFTDQETSLVYYGHRYYSPALGRFINRDPIEEAGGLNLYGFAGNDGINGWDVLGLNAFTDWLSRTFGGGRGSGSTPADRAGRGGGSIEDPWLWPPWPPFDPFDPWPFDPYDDDDYDSGPDYPSRYPGVTAPLGPLPRMPFTSVAQGRSDGPYSAKRLVYGYSPNNGAGVRPDRITDLDSAILRARDILLRSGTVDSRTDEDHILIRVRFDANGKFYELTNVMSGDPNAPRAHVPHSTTKIVASDQSVVALVHVHPDSEQGRLSGADVRYGVFYGIRVAAVSVSGDGRGEAEVYVPPFTGSEQLAERRKYAERWREIYEKPRANEGVIAYLLP